ncbi:NADH-quinone oxidoreductase subunit M [bacterium]|jgi:NADH-quinone oxidoreductase subunit M|nr:NADH-quinone oxidoreductase subunit M [bacterium]
MEGSSSLSFLLTVPLLGAAIAFLVPKGVQRAYAVIGSLLYLGLSVYETSALLFATKAEVVQSLLIDHKLSWIPDLGVTLGLRLDGLSAWFVVLNALVAVVAFSTKGAWYRKQPRLFTILGFFLMFALNVAFLSTDLVLFYLAYEAVFIPMIFMVGVWGENQKAASVFRFFLMSFFGSILMLVSIFYLVSKTAAGAAGASSGLTELIEAAARLDPETAAKVCAGFFLAFAIKVPLVPFHGWLKDVYTNAPAPGTIWMSGILSKLGVFGMLRFVLPLFPGVLPAYQGWLVTLAAVSVIYAALLAVRASNPKSLLAYSSISHLGFVMLGVFTLKGPGTGSAVLLSVGHTLASALLFFLLSMIEERKEGLDLNTGHGLARAYPVLFTALFAAVLASVSLPGTINFAGEFLVLLHAYPVSALCTIIAGLGVILGAVYMLRFFQQMGFGGKAEGEPVRAVARDLAGYELLLTLGLVAALIYGGFQTAIFLKGN